MVTCASLPLISGPYFSLCKYVGKTLGFVSCYAFATLPFYIAGIYKNFNRISKILKKVSKSKIFDLEYLLDKSDLLMCDFLNLNVKHKYKDKPDQRLGDKLDNPNLPSSDTLNEKI